jgi:uncharacterized protein YggL (DUF469 family)
VDDQRRKFLCQNAFRHLGSVVNAFKQGIAEARDKHAFDSFFESYESSYALTLAYPEEILIETARKEGITVEGRDKNAIVKELFEKKGGYSHQ